MRVVAKEWQNFVLQPLKLYEFLTAVFEQCTKLNSSSNLTSYRWAADAGPSYTRWRRNFLKDESNSTPYTPPFPVIAFSDLPIIYPQHIPVLECRSLASLAILAASEDLVNIDTHKPDPNTATFVPIPGQGLVLREGYVVEGNHRVSQAKPGSLTSKFLEQIRKSLPLADTNKGMLLVRVTNIPCIPLSSVHSTEITPYHVDRPLYGEAVYGLSIMPGSCLVFKFSRNSAPTLILPDFEGMMYKFDSVLRHKYVHGVPNTSVPRISVTWRPVTHYDLLDKSNSSNTSSLPPPPPLSLSPPPPLSLSPPKCTTSPPDNSPILVVESPCSVKPIPKLPTGTCNDVWKCSTQCLGANLSICSP